MFALDLMIFHLYARNYLSVAIVTASINFDYLTVSYDYDDTAIINNYSFDLHSKKIIQNYYFCSNCL